LAWRTVFLAGRGLAVAGILLSLLLLFAARHLAKLLAPGFDPERIGLTTMFLAAMALAVPLGLGANLAIAVSNGLYRFRVPSLRAPIQNVAVLLAILLALGTGSVVFLGFSIPLALLAILILVLWSLRGAGIVPARVLLSETD
jgi:hypothetical protein